ncbi:Dabb family protein [Flagellimonas meishanensis]|uniref:Dabb family protein n=1 Tax=Flagellimonas meishanensis TaxID=2873264 RepID=UPI001CA62C88|nr:Dabb family protein [[Muricauda] meishanensis]
MKTVKLIALLLFMVSTFGRAQSHDTESIFDHEFAHVVYFWLKNPDNEVDRAKFETSLKKFLANSEYAKTKFIGKPPRAIRGVVDDSFTYSLILSFDSAKAQAAYQVEAPHLLFIEECEDLWEKVIVYDSEGIKP